jgi:Protein of unknown function (DUF1488)
MCADIHLLRNDADIHFLRNDQNPRWDVREAEKNWLCRELRFDADVGSLRVICRIPFRDFVSAFGPIPDENAFEVFEKHRAKIEDAAREIILSGSYTSDIAWGDPDTASILMTGPNIQRAQ